MNKYFLNAIVLYEKGGNTENGTVRGNVVHKRYSWKNVG